MNKENIEEKDQDKQIDEVQDQEVAQEDHDQKVEEETDMEIAKEEDDEPENSEVEEKTMESEEDPLGSLKSELDETKDKYLRLYSEFENFRRRTAKERLDMIKTANEELLLDLLPVMDDFERANKVMEENKDTKITEEGFSIIFNKFNKVLEQKGVKPMEISKGDPFDPDFQDGIAQVPVDDESLKGKIYDVVEKGYLLGDKVIRFAKVVIGS